MLHHHHHTSAEYVRTLDADRAAAMGGCRRRGSQLHIELESIVAAAISGDESAWNEIIERFGPRLHRIARARGLTQHQAEDAVQETWVRLLRSIAGVRNADAIGGWLATTARNESARLHERSQRERPMGGEPFPEPVTSDETHTGLDPSTYRAAVEEALDDLPPRHRALMRALFADTESSYIEISDALEIPIGSIGPIRARCFAKLRLNTRLRQLAQTLD